MNDSKRRLIRNTLSSYGRFALTAVIFLVLTPLIVRSIGTAGYGLWTLVLSVVGFFGVLDLGFGTAVVKFVGESRGLGDTQRRNEFVSTTLAIYCVLGVLSALGVWALSTRFVDLFQVPLSRAGEATLVLWIVALRSVVLSLPLSTFRGALFGSERIHEVNVVQLVGVGVYAVGILGVVRMEAGIVGLAVANLVAMLVEHALYVGLCYRLLPDFRLSLAGIRADRFREVGSYSLYALVALLSGIVLLRMDPAIVSAFLPLGAVAAYGVALKLSEHGLVLTKQFVNVLTPYFARSSGAGDNADAANVFERASRLAVLPPALLFVSAAALGGDALRAWLGADFAAGGAVLVVLAGATVVSAPQLVASTYLFMSGRQRFSALAAALAIPLNVAASLLLVGRLGMVGVALGTLSATVIVDLFVLIPYALRSLGIPPGRYTVALLRTSLPMAAQGVTLFLARSAGLTDSLVGVAAAGSAGALVFLGATWLGVLDDTERALVRNGWRYGRRSGSAQALEGVGR